MERTLRIIQIHAAGKLLGHKSPPRLKEVYDALWG